MVWFLSLKTLLLVLDYLILFAHQIDDLNNKAWNLVFSMVLDLDIPCILKSAERNQEKQHDPTISKIPNKKLWYQKDLGSNPGFVTKISHFVLLQEPQFSCCEVWTK